jgi:hypothetical protein
VPYFFLNFLRNNFFTDKYLQDYKRVDYILEKSTEALVCFNVQCPLLFTGFKENLLVSRKFN